MVDRVRRADDQRARGLAEDRRQARHRHRLTRSGRRARGRGRPGRAGRRPRRAGRACAARRRRAVARRGAGTASTPRRRSACRSRRWGRDASRPKPSPGTYSSRRWIVVASAPVSSASRRAAFPVGAHSRTDFLFARSRSTSARIDAVLPTPGPPVRTESRLRSACSTADHWSSVGTNSPTTGRVSSRSASTGSARASSRARAARRRSIAARRASADAVRVARRAWWQIESPSSRRGAEPARAEPVLSLRDEARPLLSATSCRPTTNSSAVENALRSRLLPPLPGGPGAGKTASMRALVELLRAQQEVGAPLCADGQAARRLAELTGSQRDDRLIAFWNMSPPRASAATLPIPSTAATC